MSEGNMERDYAVRHHLRGYPFGELKTASGDESAYQFAGIPICCVSSTANRDEILPEFQGARPGHRAALFLGKIL